MRLLPFDSAGLTNAIDPLPTFSVDSQPPVLRQEAATALDPMDVCFELRRFGRLQQSSLL
jgi:hypothetical protein